MEVLFITHKFPPGVGGMQKQSYELVQGFRKRNKVHVIYHDPSAENKFAFFRSLKKRIKKTLDANPEIQLVHCNDGVCAFFCRWIKDKYDVKLCVTFHGLDLLWPNRIYQRRLPKLVSKFDGLICVSDFTADECRARGFNPDLVKVVYNGVDLIPDYREERVEPHVKEIFRSLGLKGKKVLMSIGRPVKRKGFGWFVEEVLPNLGDDYYYIIIGPGTSFNSVERFFISLLPKKMRMQLFLFFGWSTDQQSLNRQLADSTQSNKFRWLNKVSYDSLLYGLQNSDLFVMPNLKVEGDAEGFGLVALESLTQSCYVLASDIDGIPSAIQDGKNGTLVKSGDPIVWQNAINKHFLQSKNALAEQLDLAQEFMREQYSWSKMVRGYESVFESILKQQ